MTLQITTSTYQPDTMLDQELAVLGYDGMLGWPDQRPVTTSLVRSRLRPAVGAPSSALVLARTGRGTLAGAAALRYPAAAGGPARLWGPVVAPAERRHGLGTMLLERAMQLWSDEALTVRTAEIPQTREHGCRLFEQAGWTLHSTAALLRGAPTTSAPSLTSSVEDCPQIRAAGDGDAEALAQLYQTVHPEQGFEVAADTLRRWRADERYAPDALLVVPGIRGDFLAAALVYPLAHANTQEASEALLGDVLIHPSVDRAATAPPLIEAAIRAGVRHGAKVVRAVVPTLNRPLINELSDAGLQQVETIRYYEASPTPPHM